MCLDLCSFRTLLWVLCSLEKKKKKNHALVGVTNLLLSQRLRGKDFGIKCICDLKYVLWMGQNEEQYIKKFTCSAFGLQVKISDST